MKNLIILISCFLFFQGSAFAGSSDRWIYLTSNNDTKSKFYVDPNSIAENSESIREAWVKMKFIKPKMGVSYIVSKYAFDCNNDKMLILSAYAFNSNGGSMGGGAPTQDNQVKDVVPDTIDELLKNTICHINLV